MSVASLVGIGLYTIAEAARLTGVPARSIRRWIVGYKSLEQGTHREYPPLWTRQVDESFDEEGLGFLDLIEVRFVHAFRTHGISLQAIRLAAKRAATLFDDTHPFATKRFSTDGRSIFAEVLEELGEMQLLDLVKNQYAFREVIQPSLYNSLVFEDGTARRWFPNYPQKTIYVDPAIAFGRPVVAARPIRTDVLAAAVRAEGAGADAIAAVARMFEVAPTAVQQAVDYETRLAA